ncbi:hypothetical protein SLEP1_g44103 [Rubroshorea leprosula]|uniref:Uncharacterized protein n=1 Tax=Rubroshorea leprosula TaxID=152421 RepID=A0AAV5LF47_9ROSI|nr:hypothetical protein SLEP1_g44103 [Rubroshorea leprosula]
MAADGQGRRAEQNWDFSGLREKILSPKSCYLSRKEGENPKLGHQFSQRNESVARGAWRGLSGGRVEKKKKMRKSKTRG